MHHFQLAVMLFVALASAVPTEMLKREPLGVVHCDLACRPVDCGDRPVTFRDCFGNPCGCAD
ncbi:hypothetical protein GGX14DRAFT_568855 [Mycena pura]|uniref:Uncharacterized protein n=1 Tax=Mycena pura TaxID=153505 RepID=A0AAD6V8Y3_9AGAR|nr:hypothetical protein GGX14DRAFT_568855 [Mycena pura]